MSPENGNPENTPHPTGSAVQNPVANVPAAPSSPTSTPSTTPAAVQPKPAGSTQNSVSNEHQVPIGASLSSMKAQGIIKEKGKYNHKALVIYLSLLLETSIIAWAPIWFVNKVLVEPGEPNVDYGLLPWFQLLLLPLATYYLVNFLFEKFTGSSEKVKISYIVLLLINIYLSLYLFVVGVAQIFVSSHEGLAPLGALFAILFFTVPFFVLNILSIEGVKRKMAKPSAEEIKKIDSLELMLDTFYLCRKAVYAGLILSPLIFVGGII